LTSRSINNSNYRYSYTGANTTTNYCPNGLNQYAAVGTSSCPSAGTSYSYDDRAHTYGYDLDNKLTCVGSSCATMSLGYDPTGWLQTECGLHRAICL
jgi:hypothetical protein